MIEHVLALSNFITIQIIANPDVSIQKIKEDLRIIYGNLVDEKSFVTYITRIHDYQKEYVLKTAKAKL